MIRFHLSSIALLLALAACSVGPDYQKPELQAPQQWVSQPNGNPVPAKQQTEAADADGVQRAWWKRFHDPILDKLIDTAVAGNPDVKIAEARIDEARAARDSAHADLLPKGDVKDEYQRINLPSSFGFPGLSNPLQAYQAGVDASWELDLFGGHRREVEARSADLQSYEASRDDTLVSLMAELARNYIDARSLQAQIRVAQDTINADQSTYNVANERFHKGQAAGLDALQAESQLRQDEAQLPLLTGQLAQSTFALDVLLGQNPGTVQAMIGTQGNIPMADGAYVLAAPASVINNRPDIRVAERKLAAATAEQGVAVAAFYPDISLKGFLGFLSVTNVADLFSKSSKFYTFSATGTWNILNYSSLEANLQNAKAEQREALAQYQKIVLVALTDVEKSLTAYNQQLLYRQSLTAARNAASASLRVAEERYRGGLTNYFDVLDAKRSLYAVQQQIVRADAGASENLVSVYRNLGGGWQSPTK